MRNKMSYNHASEPIYKPQNSSLNSSKQSLNASRTASPYDRGTGLISGFLTFLADALCDSADERFRSGLPAYLLRRAAALLASKSAASMPKS